MFIIGSFVLNLNSGMSVACWVCLLLLHPFLNARQQNGFNFLNFSATIELQLLAGLPSTPLIASHSLDDKLNTAVAGTLGPQNTVVLDSYLI